VVERHSSVLGREELIEGAVPGVELAGWMRPGGGGMGGVTAPRSVTGSVSSQPGLCSLAGAMTGWRRARRGRRTEHLCSLPEVLIEDAPEAQLIERGPHDEDRSPVGGRRVGVGGS
jgi:hypothetical protein